MVNNCFPDLFFRFNAWCLVLGACCLFGLFFVLRSLNDLKKMALTLDIELKSRRDTLTASNLNALTSISSNTNSHGSLPISPNHSNTPLTSPSVSPNPIRRPPVPSASSGSAQNLPRPHKAPLTSKSPRAQSLTETRPTSTSQTSPFSTRKINAHGGSQDSPLLARPPHQLQHSRSMRATQGQMKHLIAGAENLSKPFAFSARRGQSFKVKSTHGKDNKDVPSAVVANLGFASPITSSRSRFGFPALLKQK
jgi:hypothetical protein